MSKKKRNKKKEPIEQLACICDKARKIGGSVQWTGEINDQGGFILAINIPI